MKQKDYLRIVKFIDGLLWAVVIFVLTKIMLGVPQVCNRIPFYENAGHYGKIIVWACASETNALILYLIFFLILCGGIMSLISKFLKEEER